MTKEMVPEILFPFLTRCRAGGQWCGPSLSVGCEERHGPRWREGTRGGGRSGAMWTGVVCLSSRERRRKRGGGRGGSRRKGKRRGGGGGGDRLWRKRGTGHPVLSLAGPYRKHRGTRRWKGSTAARSTRPASLPPPTSMRDGSKGKRGRIGRRPIRMPTTRAHAFGLFCFHFVHGQVLSRWPCPLLHAYGMDTSFQTAPGLLDCGCPCFFLSGILP